MSGGIGMGLTKYDIISRLQLLGVDIFDISLINSIQFSLYKSEYNIVEGKNLNFKWYVDQLRQYRDDNKQLAENLGKMTALMARQRKFIKNIVDNSWFNGEPVKKIADGIVYEIVAELLHRNYEMTKYKYHNGSYDGNYNMLMVEDMVYKVWGQVISIVLAADNKISASSLIVDNINILIGNTLVTQYRYKVVMERSGGVKVTRIKTDGKKSTYCIDRLVIQTNRGEKVLEGSFKIQYGSMDKVIIRDSFMEHIKVGINRGDDCEYTDWAIVENTLRHKKDIKDELMVYGFDGNLILFR